MGGRGLFVSLALFAIVVMIGSELALAASSASHRATAPTRLAEPNGSQGAAPAPDSDEAQHSAPTQSFWGDTGVALGGGLFFEKTNEVWTSRLRSPASFALQSRLGWLLTRVEYSSDTSADSSGAVSVLRTREHATLWAVFPLDTEATQLSSGVSFQTGLGLSAVRNRPGTELIGGGVERPSVQFAPGFAASFGVARRLNSLFGLRADLRYESGPQFRAEDNRWGVHAAIEVFPFALY